MQKCYLTSPPNSSESSDHFLNQQVEKQIDSHFVSEDI